MKKNLIVLIVLMTFLFLLSHEKFSFAEGKKKGKEKKKELTLKEKLDKLINIGKKFAREMEIKARKNPPEWTKDDKKEIFKFVHITDIHMTLNNKSRQKAVLGAVDYINKKIKPSWVVITGDNVWSSTKEGFIKVNKLLKKMLDENLKCKYFIIKGDNDSRDYEKVFGSSNWSFDFGGMHFVGIGLDIDIEGYGIGLFTELKWLHNNLKKNRDKPTILFNHEPLYPYNFLSAQSIELVCWLNKNVPACLVGHIHYDIEITSMGIKNIMTPALFRRGNPIKVCHVYKDHITIKTHEKKDGKYHFANKWQRIIFPKKLKIKNPPKKLKVKNFTATPPKPTMFLKDLKKKFDQMKKILEMFRKKKKKGTK